MGEMLSAWLWELGRTTLFLTVAAVLVAVVLRLSRIGSPWAHRAAWCLVLLVGWLFIRLPVAIPWYEASRRNEVARGGIPSLEIPAGEQKVGDEKIGVPVEKIAQDPPSDDEKPSETSDIGAAVPPGSALADGNSRPLVEIPAPPDEPNPVGSRMGAHEHLSSEASTPPTTILAKRAASTSKTVVVAMPPQGGTTSARGGLSWFSWSLTLAALWLAGMVAAVVRWLAGYVRSIRAMSTAAVPDEESLRQWRELLAEQRITREIPLRLTPGMGPLLCRWPDGYELVVPAELWPTLGPAARESIMRHELAHYQRGDVWKSLAVRLLALPHWFNPAAWWAVRRFEAAAEWACDEAAVASGTRHTEFARTLLALAEASLGGGSCHPAMSRWNLSARIRRLVNSSRVKDSIMKKIILASLAVVLVAFCLVRVDLVAKTPAAQSEPRPSGSGMSDAAPTDVGPANESQPPLPHGRGSVLGRGSEVLPVASYPTATSDVATDPTAASDGETPDFRKQLLADELRMYFGQLSRVETNLRTLQPELKVAEMALKRLDTAPANSLELEKMKLQDARCRELEKSIGDLQVLINQAQGRSKPGGTDPLVKQLTEQVNGLQAELNARLAHLADAMTQVKRSELTEKIADLAVKVTLAAEERESLQKTINGLRGQLEKTTKPSTSGIVTPPSGATAGLPISVPTDAAAADMPHEGAMISLPTYRVEPPDILQVGLVNMVPKPPYRIGRHDVLNIRVTGTLLDQPINNNYLVEAEGTVILGPAYGRVAVAGLTVEEAEKAVQKKLELILTRPQVSVELSRSSGLQPVKGTYLIGPDGTINLRTYGSVHVAGKTLAEVRETLEKHFARWFQSPEITVEVASYNSKVYYVIIQTLRAGSNVFRVPSTGKETVLDALAQARGLRILPATKIWVARLAADGKEATLPIDFDAIAQGRDTTTNYQLMPGDRVFVSGADLVETNQSMVSLTPRTTAGTPSRPRSTQAISGAAWWLENYSQAAGATSRAVGQGKTIFITIGRSPARIGPTVGVQEQFWIEVCNTGKSPLAGVKVECRHDKALRPTDATEGFQVRRDGLFWTIDSLAPGATVKFRLYCECISATERASLRVTATTPDGDRAEAETSLKIQPAPKQIVSVPRADQFEEGSPESKPMGTTPAAPMEKEGETKPSE